MEIHRPTPSLFGAFLLGDGPEEWDEVAFGPILASLFVSAPMRKNGVRKFAGVSFAAQHAAMPGLVLQGSVLFTPAVHVVPPEGETEGQSYRADVAACSFVAEVDGVPIYSAGAEGRTFWYEPNVDDAPGQAFGRMLVQAFRIVFVHANPTPRIGLGTASLLSAVVSSDPMSVEEYDLLFESIRQQVYGDLSQNSLADFLGRTGAAFSRYRADGQFPASIAVPIRLAHRLLVQGNSPLGAEGVLDLLGLGYASSHAFLTLQPTPTP